MAAAKAASTLAADRYAQALFELANEEGVLDAVAADIEGLGKLIAESADLGRLVQSPIYTREQQGAAMAEILDKAGASALTKKFIALVARNRRLFMLSNIARSFGRLLARQRGEIEASVTSAQPLSDAQVADLKGTLRAAYGKEPRLTVAVDKSLIAGLIVKVGSRMIDSSLRTKLNSLKTVLTEA